jgi:hypothetical protein
MANIFCITYGGPARNGNTYVPYKAIAHTADEAIAVINTWQTYGGKRDYASPIMVNATTEQKIRDLFRDGLGTYPGGQPRTYVGLRTTGCGAWEIGFHPALADTLEEHESIYNERREAAKAERKRLAEAAIQGRLAELNEQRKGWYHAELTIRAMVFAQKGNDYMTDLTFSGNVIADSGADAYDKALKHVMDHPEELTHRGNIATLHAWPDMTSHDYSFTFLGVKTDEGFSIDKWNEWKEKGEI